VPAASVGDTSPAQVTLAGWWWRGRFLVFRHNAHLRMAFVSAGYRFNGKCTAVVARREQAARVNVAAAC
jgi:hypothetical protein